MPKELEILKQKIWENLRGKINPRTRKKYTESESFAIATARLKDSPKQTEHLSGHENEEPKELLTHAIKEMEV